MVCFPQGCGEGLPYKRHGGLYGPFLDVCHSKIGNCLVSGCFVTVWSARGIARASPLCLPHFYDLMWFACVISFLDTNSRCHWCTHIQLLLVASVSSIVCSQ